MGTKLLKFIYKWFGRTKVIYFPTNDFEIGNFIYQQDIKRCLIIKIDKGLDYYKYTIKTFM